MTVRRSARNHRSPSLQTRLRQRPARPAFAAPQGLRLARSSAFVEAARPVLLVLVLRLVLVLVLRLRLLLLRLLLLRLLLLMLLLLLLRLLLR